MKSRSVALVVGTAMVAAVSISVAAQRNQAANAAAQRNEKPQAVNEEAQAAQDLATRVGQILGAAMACRDIARPRIGNMTDMLSEVFKVSATNEDELNAIKQLYDKNVAEGQSAVTRGRIDCAAADSNLTNLENAITSKGPVVAGPTPSTPAVAAPRAARAAAVAAAPAPAALVVAPPPRATTAAIPSVPAPVAGGTPPP